MSAIRFPVQAVIDHCVVGCVYLPFALDSLGVRRVVARVFPLVRDRAPAEQIQAALDAAAAVEVELHAATTGALAQTSRRGTA